MKKQSNPWYVFHKYLVHQSAHCPFPYQDKKNRTPLLPLPTPTPNMKELSKPILEGHALRKAAHMVCNAAPSLTSTVSLATVATTHSTVNSKDCQGPECTHRPFLP